jgi:hypothetical protein
MPKPSGETNTFVQPCEEMAEVTQPCEEMAEVTQPCEEMAGVSQPCQDVADFAQEEPTAPRRTQPKRKAAENAGKDLKKRKISKDKKPPAGPARVPFVKRRVHPK